jgi:succinate dehydrogenase flavin-adding protein (antitoxin of CptAB toxin-antitoxin module)
MELWEKRLREYERKDRERQLKEFAHLQDRRRQSGHEPGDPPSAPAPRRLPFPTKIPRRLLRTPPGAEPRVDTFVKFLVREFKISVDADHCYAIKRGAADGNYRLVKFLLKRGASVTQNEHIAFKAAINNKDLEMMKLLVEPSGFKINKKTGAPVTSATGDPVPLPDRLNCPREWVDLALRNKAYDIVRWLVDEKREYTSSID